MRFTEQAKSYGYKVVLHSCGAIERTIPALIDAGVDGLHPFRRWPRSMYADTLSRKYGDALVWIGGVGTQRLLPFGTPDEVRAEWRLKKLFGPRFVVSPSHEALLPSVSVDNLLAMAETAGGRTEDAQRGVKEPK